MHHEPRFKEDEMPKQRFVFVKPAAFGVTLATAAVAGLVAVGCAESARPSEPHPGPLVPNFAVTGPSSTSCDIDITVNGSLSGSTVQSEEATVYNFHVLATRNASSGVASVTATADQLPGATIDLLTPAIDAPAPYVVTDSIVPAPQDPSPLYFVNQAGLDSVAQEPVDVFCHVVRTPEGPALAPGTVGTQGTYVQSASYANGVAASTTVDASSGLQLQQVVTINGAVVRDTRYEYASTADAAVYRSRTTVMSPMVVAGKNYTVQIDMVTRNVSRSGGQ
jgi:hypothetical protein